MVIMINMTILPFVLSIRRSYDGIQFGLSFQVLLLSRNEIVKIHQMAFHGLSKLEELDISHNQLTMAPSLLYVKNTLQILDVSWNKIKTTSVTRILTYVRRSTWFFWAAINWLKSQMCKTYHKLSCIYHLHLTTYPMWSLYTKSFFQNWKFYVLRKIKLQASVCPQLSLLHGCVTYH